jgi:hypothetical protein
MDDKLLEQLKSNLSQLNKPARQRGRKQEVLDALQPQLKQKFDDGFSLREIVEAISTPEFTISPQALHVWAVERGLFKKRRRQRRTQPAPAPTGTIKLPRTATPSSTSTGKPLTQVAKDNF